MGKGRLVGDTADPRAEVPDVPMVWPGSMGLNGEDVYAWIDANVGPVLRDHGFSPRGSKSRYVRPTIEICGVIEFQRSVSSRRGHEKFVVNMGVWSRAVGLALGSTRVQCPSWMDCHIGYRLGELGPDRAETWWLIDPTSENREVSLGLRRALEHEAIPFLDAVGTAEGFESFWQAQGGSAAGYFLDLLARGKRMADSI